MANPFLSAMGGAKGPQGGPIGFVQFMNQMKGKDPNQILNQMLSSGRINQDQVNQAQQMAQKMGEQFNGFKSMFGF